MELLDGLERPDGGRGAQVVMTLPVCAAVPVFSSRELTLWPLTF